MRARKFHYMIVYIYLRDNGATGDGSSFYSLPKRISSMQDVESVREQIQEESEFKNVIITDYKLVRESRG